MTELELLREENQRLKDEIAKLKNNLYWEERRKKAYARDWQRDSDELRALKAALKELVG